ncbi:pickpocket protein 28 [Drosophila subobscura]|uniref:pickpocket protein 28 n=1 Tax=Drosophila subobscura TaxID=7241 RepID=UPI00155ABAC5|nr:pickpocket protein 28 [Drosophila subobscura]
MQFLSRVQEKLCRNSEKRRKIFLRNTSLELLKYVVGDRHFPWWIKLYFISIFASLIYVAVNLAVRVFVKWEDTPVIIGISSTMTPISKIPFPAITVCNMNQAKKSKVEDLMPGSLGYSMLQKTCYKENAYGNSTESNHRYKNETFPNFILDVSERCEDLIVSCTFHKKKLPCTDIFREIFVDEGLCCVFNLLHPYYLYKFRSTYIRDYTSTNRFADIAVDWNPISGYPQKLPSSYYPRPGVGIGIAMGLQIILNGHVDDYFCSSTNGQGFKVLLYNPIDQPRMKESGLPVMIGHQTTFRIIARSFEALPNIRNIHRTKRQCIFSDEEELYFYRYYTRRNCESECDALFFLRRCDCIPYYLPLVFSNATVCEAAQFDCWNNAELQIFDEKSSKCKDLCLTSCHDLTFFPDAFTTPFSQQDLKAQSDYLKNLSNDYIRKNLAVVNFYFSENYFRSNVRTSYTGTTEYMSLTGGIMSLMIGFSVIFIAEFLYVVVLFVLSLFFKF